MAHSARMNMWAEEEEEKEGENGNSFSLGS